MLCGCVDDFMATILQKQCYAYTEYDAVDCRYKGSNFSIISKNFEVTFVLLRLCFGFVPLCVPGSVILCLLLGLA